MRGIVCVNFSIQMNIIILEIRDLKCLLAFNRTVPSSFVAQAIFNGGQSDY